MVNIRDTENYVNKQKSKLAFCGALSFNPLDRKYLRAGRFSTIKRYGITCVVP